MIVFERIFKAVDGTAHPDTAFLFLTPKLMTFTLRDVIGAGITDTKIIEEIGVGLREEYKEQTGFLPVKEEREITIKVPMNCYPLWFKGFAERWLDEHISKMLSP